MTEPRAEAESLLDDVAALVADLRERMLVDLAAGQDARPPAPPALRRPPEGAEPPPRAPSGPVAGRPPPSRPAPIAPVGGPRAPAPVAPTPGGQAPGGPPPSAPDWRTQDTGTWGRFDRPTGPGRAPTPAGPSAASGALFDSATRFRPPPGPSTPAAVGHPSPWAAVTGAWYWPDGGPAPAPGTRAATAADALLAVRAELGDCARCRLCEGRKNLVFGMGSPSAALAVVGEGPGATEDERGLPFVGASGEMLDRMLQNVVGLDRRAVYILNVVKCRPPGNRNPEPDEVAACQGFLFAQLRAIRPRVILSLGRPATQTLLATTRPMNALRGTWHLWGEVPVMPTFHPAYLLRNPADKGKTFEDLKLLRARMEELGLL